MELLNFEKLLEKSIKTHGHLCGGQVIGIRMSQLALARIGISDPLGLDSKKVYVIVEIDRCATDAIQSVTGCSLGKRSMKWLDFGVMAATFVNLENNKGVRVVAREESRELSKKYCNEILDKYGRQLEAYKIMPENELFQVEDVAVVIPPEDLPGRPLSRVQCTQCKDWVQDKREVEIKGETLCRQCAYGSYYQQISN